jgi:RND family efflux transporter MFP subunit
MKISIIFIAGLIIGIIATSLFFLSCPTLSTSSDSENQSASEGIGVPDRPVFPVRVDVADEIQLERRITVIGRARARREAPIVPQTGGIVRDVAVRNGMRVSEDQILFTLDDREHVIRLREAEERLLERRIEYNIMKAGPTPATTANDEMLDLLVEMEEQYRRASEAYELGELSDRELRHIRREYEATRAYLDSRREEVIANKSGLSQAEQAYERAQLTLSHTRVRAPFDGHVAGLDIQKGLTVQTGREYGTVIDLHTVHIEAGVIESELPHIKENFRVYARFPALGDEQFEGRVHSVSPLIDRETRTARVTVAIPNPDGIIKPGMFANLEIITDVIPDALVVPREAVLVRDGRELVFRIEENRAKWQYVTPGERNPEYVHILRGIARGDTVAVDGHHTLAHDSRIMIRE